ncbi:DUF3095 domain-containing protein [Flavobacterium sp. MAH-1]|uniref:DUF3095 domain-containing protein n=1 Tax=Flavobacterium agri TaxID=2743471 RepID=A0A7Y8Y135_9FLAO|nr:DUF3095 family protein [Flavobacterium agri]NUY80517.1 DUF3095 domain-containing protein [Flavobacterium agri]NYA70542.1 DUF3095 domain-containing protein [Flavobacterium agri]
MQTTSDFFYSGLTAHKIPLPELLGDDRLFSDVPADWTVIITDIRNSTEAVFGGRHQTVNLLATGSIVTVLNIAFKLKLSVPFFFGGDGATFIVPPALCEQALGALQLFKQNTMENFGLDIRVGKVAVADIFASGHKLRISKYYNSSIFSIPIVLGDGLIHAEKIIKGNDFPIEDFSPSEHALDLSGMQCRWDRIAPPKDKEEIVTLLVMVTENGDQSQVFKSILSKIDELYGAPRKRQPISVGKLRQKTTFGRLGTEMRARIGKIKVIELLREKLISLYAYIYLRTVKGRRYLEKLVDMSDTLVLDGKINTVISGNRNQREALQSFLDVLEIDSQIVYGIHISTASIMSCYVRDFEDGHIHFVDGSDGGYTQAARMLKAKLAK